MFKLSSNSASGTSLKGYVAASYADLAARFGEPTKSDGYKVSTEWVFEDDAGNVATLYDYKETSLYDRSLPSVAKFRARKRYDWHIGAASDDVANAFKEFIENGAKEPLTKAIVPGSNPATDYTDFALSTNERDLLTEGLRLIYNERVNRAREQSHRPSELAMTLAEIVTLAKKLGDEDM